MVMIVSLLAGSFAFRPVDGITWPGFALIVLSALSGFLSFTPLRMLFKLPVGIKKPRAVSWFIIYFLISITSFLLLVAVLDRPGLVWFIAPAILLTVTYLWVSAAKKKRVTFVEICGIAGLALAGPAAAYLQLNQFNSAIIALYLLLVIWFVDRMITTRGILAIIKSGLQFTTSVERASALKRELTVHGLALASVILVLSVFRESAPFVLIIPFGLATLRNLYDIITNRQATDPMKVGFAEMRLGLAFCLLFIICWRLSG